MLRTDQQTLESIREGNREVLGEVYARYRVDFVRFGRRYTLPDEVVTDVWQDTIVNFYENITNGRLTTLTSSLKTYLFSLGKYALIDESRRRNRRTAPVANGQQLIEIHPDERPQPLEANEALDVAITRLGERCRKLLIHFYYDNFAVEAIAERMGYANENTVSAHKSRCMKKLRELLTPKNKDHA